jgi:tetratricopeptide (TPR) repeat protein
MIGVTLSGYAQSTIGDEIQAMESRHQKEQEMYQLVNESNQLLETDRVTALAKLEKALKISFDIKNKRGEAFTYQSLATLHMKSSNYKEAVNYYEKALKLFKRIDDDAAYYKTVRFLAQAYEHQGDNAMAERFYKQYLDLAMQKKSLTDELFARESIARTQFNQSKFFEANNTYKKLLISYRANNDSSSINKTYENIGKCYAGLKDTTNAVKYFKLAGKTGVEQSIDQRNYLQNVGRTYNSAGNYRKSVEYERQAKKINTKNKDYEQVWDNNFNIANDLILLNEADQAIPLLQENINLGNEMGELRSTGETYKALSDAYVQLGNFKEAKNSFDAYKKAQEKLLDERERQINEKGLENASVTDKEKQIELLIRDRDLDEKRIQLLEQEQNQKNTNLRQQRLMTYGLATLALLLLVGVVFFYRSSRQKQLANKLLSIRSLRSQMNPHFIFNSLNSVNSFISQSDERSANKYLTEFARLMRTVLEHSKKDFVVLADELEVLDRYLKLEYIRFKDQFEYDFEVDENLEISRLLIPPMLVQPYIENAIWHGLRYKEGVGNLTVSFHHTTRGMRIVVTDDGIGREKSKALKTKNQKKDKSTGISNTASRLQLLNEVHGITISHSISDLKEDGSGTHVELTIPFIDVDDKKYAESNRA